MFTTGTWRDAGLMGELGEGEGGERSVVGGLNHTRAPSCQRCSNLNTYGFRVVNFRGRDLA
jgi:hypothetical protein